MKIRKFIALAGVSLACMTPILLALDAECEARAKKVREATGSEEAGLDEYVTCMIEKQIIGYS